MSKPYKPYTIELQIDSVPGTVAIDMERRCYGSGSWECDNAACKTCKGKGFYLTYEGQALIDFMKRWL